MSIHSFSDDDENYELAELEAESQALQQAYAAQLAALEAEETGAPLAPPATAAASALEAENAKLKAQLAALESASAIKSTIRHDSELAKQKAELEKMAAENAKLTEALASGVGLSKLTTLTPSVVSASKARTASLSKSLSSSVAHTDMVSALKDLETREKGVDICVLMDGTGSMGWCLESCKAKARDIMSAASTVHPDAITRVACVIYRDLEARPIGMQIADFVGKQDLHIITSFLSGVHAIRNRDTCEDVTGGLEETLKLSWKSSTKLVIHFGDAPAHGRQYHSGYAGDHHPSGDPKGRVPERYVKQLCNNRVNYYFAQINRSTQRMTDMFAKEYEHSQNAVFKVLDREANASTFIPLVVESIRDSMKRSAFFGSGKKASSSGWTAKADPRTVFHSIL